MHGRDEVTLFSLGLIFVGIAMMTYALLLRRRERQR
jgi:hypothetical protein